VTAVGDYFLKVWEILPIGVQPRRLGGCSPTDSGKGIIFPAKAKFFGQKPAAKNEKYIF